MSETKHSVAPWMLGKFIPIRTGQSLSSAVILSSGPFGVLAAVYHVAERDIECRANAQLIAAAPDMLAILAVLVHDVLKCSAHYEPCIHCEICTVLYKATGDEAYNPTQKDGVQVPTQTAGAWEFDAQSEGAQAVDEVGQDKGV